MATRDNFFRIFKGDDTDFTGNQTLIVKLETEMSLAGMTAHVRFLDFQQDFDPIPENKELEIVISAEQSAKFPLGCTDGSIWLTDSSGKKRTVANRVHFVVTNRVEDAYDSDDEQAITVIITSGVIDNIGWTNIIKPLTDENVFDMECSDWNFRKVVARIWQELGGKVKNND